MALIADSSAASSDVSLFWAAVGMSIIRSLVSLQTVFSHELLRMSRVNKVASFLFVPKLFQYRPLSHVVSTVTLNREVKEGPALARRCAPLCGSWQPPPVPAVPWPPSVSPAPRPSAAHTGVPAANGKKLSTIIHATSPTYSVSSMSRALQNHPRVCLTLGCSHVKEI